MEEIIQFKFKKLKTEANLHTYNVPILFVARSLNDIIISKIISNN